MNYFELFEIPVQLTIDRKALHRKFIALSREVHPDYFGQAGEAEQERMLERSADLNRAYKTLQDPDATMKYVLEMKGVLAEEEKYDLPPAFLMDVMDINEQLAEAGDGEVRTELAAIIDKLQTEIYEPVKEMVEDYKDGLVSQEGLLQIKDYHYKKKYLDRIRRQLGGKP